MKFLFFILTTFIFVQQTYAKKTCVVAKTDGKGFRHKTKAPVDFYEGKVFKPLKFNKSKTYVLVKHQGYVWIAKKDLRKVLKDSCSDYTSQVVKSYKPKKVKKVKKSRKSVTSSRIPRFQIKAGYYLSGISSVLDPVTTEVLDPSDVTLDQTPLFTGGDFESQFSIHGHYLKGGFYKKAILRGGIGYSQSSYQVTGLENPLNPNPGIPINVDQLEKKNYGSFSYSSVHLNAEIGYPVYKKNKLEVRAYLGLEYQLLFIDTLKQNIFVCTGAGCLFKNDPKVDEATLKSSYVTPTFNIEMLYNKFIFGIGMNSNAGPIINIGYSIN